MSLSIGIGRLSIGSGSQSGATPVVPVVPAFVSAIVENATPTKIAVTFDVPLDETSVPVNLCFLAESKTIVDVEISGAVVTLTVDIAFAYGDVIVLTYIKPESNPLISLTGGEALGFSEEVTNNVEEVIADELLLTTTLTGDFTINLTGNGDVAFIWPDLITEVVTINGGVSTVHALVGGGIITIQNASIISAITVSAQQLTALSGLTNIVNLEYVELPGNLLTEFETSDTWVNINHLNVDFNQLTEFIAYPGWVNIEYLDIGSNSLTEFVAYPQWTAIGTLIIYDNIITSFVGHSEWVNLVFLNISDNQISTFTAHPEWVLLEQLYAQTNLFTTFTVHSEWVSLLYFYINGCALTETAVNTILTELDSIVGLTGADINLSEGTNAIPSGAGITALESLIAEGNTVTVNMAAPENLAATVLSDTEIQLDWDDPTFGEISIERSEDGENYSEIDPVALGVEAYTDSTCVAGTLYYYYIRAFISSSYSAYSDVVSEYTSLSYVTIDNTGNIAALTNAQVKVTLTDADMDLTTIDADGGNLYFCASDNVFIHSYINFLSATLAEIYLKVSVAALSTKKIYFKLEDHVNTDDYAGVMDRRTAHTSTASLYTCADVHDSLASGPDVTLAGGAAIVSTKFGNVFSFDGSNDYMTLDLMNNYTPEYGGFGFSFVLPDDSWDNSADHCIMFKIWAGFRNFGLYILSTGLLRIYYPIPNGYVDTGVKLEVGKIHSFYIRWTKISQIMYLDGVIVHALNTRVITNPVTTGVFFFGSYDATQLMTKCYIFDIEYNSISLPVSVQRAHDENISLFNRTQTEKLTFISHLPTSITIGGTWYGEPTLIIEDDLIKCYHQKAYANDDHAPEHNLFGVSVSEDFGATWNAFVPLMGYGTDTEATKGIYQCYVLKDAGKYYVIYRRHDGVTLLIRESTDGLAFTNPQTFLTNTYGTTYNCKVINDGGTFKGIVEVGTTISGHPAYTPYYTEGATLLTMAYGGTNPQSSINTRSVYCSAGPCFRKVGSTYVLWNGQTLINDFNILPDQIYYSEATNPSNDTWVTKSTAIVEMDSIYADDQVADFTLEEYEGITYFALVKCNNAASSTFVIALYKYEGTIAQFIKDITVTNNV